MTILWGCGGDGPAASAPLEDPPPEPAPPSRPELPELPSETRETIADDDLRVLLIQRLPEMDYVPGGLTCDQEGWPAEGVAVTWVAHVASDADEHRAGVGYRWLEDGEPIAEGRVNLPAGGTAEVVLEWMWTFDRHELLLAIDPADEFVEEGATTGAPCLPMRSRWGSTSSADSTTTTASTNTSSA